MAPQVRIKNWFLLSSDDHIALCADISAKGENVPDTIFMPRRNGVSLERKCRW